LLLANPQATVQVKFWKNSLSILAELEVGDVICIRHAKSYTNFWSFHSNSELQILYRIISSKSKCRIDDVLLFEIRSLIVWASKHPLVIFAQNQITHQNKH
jgi:hypothetical protein